MTDYTIDEDAELEEMAKATLHRINELDPDTDTLDSITEEDKAILRSMTQATRSASHAHRLLPLAVAEIERLREQVRSLRHTLGQIQLLDPKGVVSCCSPDEALPRLIERVEETTATNNQMILDALFGNDERHGGPDAAA